MNRRQSLLACAAFALSLPQFLKANPSKTFPLTRVKAGEGLSLWVEVYDMDDPEQRMLPLVQEVDTEEGWIDQIVSDGKYLQFDGEHFKVERSYGNYALRWLQPTEADIAKSKEYASHLGDSDLRAKHWNETQSFKGITIPEGCIRAESKAKANELALFLLNSSFA